MQMQSCDFSFWLCAGDKIAYFVGANFTPHVLTVNTGEVHHQIYVK